MFRRHSQPQSQQQETLPPTHKRQQQFSKSSSATTTFSVISACSNGAGRGCADGAAEANTLYSNTVLQPVTPILFSTPRGLHLRVLNNRNSNDIRSKQSTSRSYAETDEEEANDYSISFCDLERWSTRANFLCLEDTFVVKSKKSAFNTYLPPSSAAASFPKQQQAHSNHSILSGKTTKTMP